MGLILSVLADPQGANMLKHTKLFTEAGGSLGRSEDNNWVLPDPERVVSSKHGLITCERNQYYLTDTSTNGTFHNSNQSPIGKGNKIALNEGDVIGVGDYELKVTLRQPQVESGLPKGLGYTDFLDQSDPTSFSPDAEAKMQAQAAVQKLDSLLDLGAAPAVAHPGEWGTVASDAHGGLAADNLLIQGSDSVDPLVAMRLSSSPGHSSERNSLGYFAEDSYSVSGTVPGQSADDDWWKEGSEQDHAPADQQAMQFAPQQPMAAKSTQTKPPPPQPKPPVQPITAPQAPAANPFAESLQVVQGQQINGVPGLDEMTPVGEQYSGVPQQFSQPQQHPQVNPDTSVNPQGINKPPAPSSPPSSPPPSPPPSEAVQQVNTPVAPPATTNPLAVALNLNLTPPQQQQLDQQAAAIVEETVARLIDLLRARTSIKNELRVQRTMIQVQANNPLKFSATAADALNAMFSGNSAFMPPQQAIKESFDDLSDHQVAVLAGIRAGFDAMLKFFNPEKLERQLNNSASLISSKNAKNWQGFEEIYKELVRDPDACYRRLFGDEFAEIYERQLSELKSARNFNHQV